MANFLIALREGVEAALIVGVLVAFLTKAGRRDVLPKLWLGVVVAAILPLAAGAFMTWGPYTLTFQAQEILGGVLSLVAVGMVTWMIVWMGKSSSALVAGLKDQAGAAIADGSSGWALVWIAIISVGREGLETAVFVWATVKATAQGGFVAPTLGVITGLVVAIVIGWLIYRGAVAINLRLFFQVTAFFLIFVAAGILSYGIGDLQEASVLPGWGNWVYDLSPYFDGHIPGLHPDAWWFVLLEAIFQFNLSPTHLQLAGWAVYLCIMLVLFFWNVKKGPRKRREATAAPTAPAQQPA